MKDEEFKNVLPLYDVIESDDVSDKKKDQHIVAFCQKIFSTKVDKEMWFSLYSGRFENIAIIFGLSLTF